MTKKELDRLEEGQTIIVKGRIAKVERTRGELVFYRFVDTGRPSVRRYRGIKLLKTKT